MYAVLTVQDANNNYRYVRAKTIGYAQGISQHHDVINWRWENKIKSPHKKLQPSSHPEWIVAHPSEQGNI